MQAIAVCNNVPAVGIPYCKNVCELPVLRLDYRALAHCVRESRRRVHHRHLAVSNQMCR